MSYCHGNLDDIKQPGYIGTTDNDYYVMSPYRDYSMDTNGIKIQYSSDYDSFTICFDPSKVGGTQKSGYIGLKDSYGDGQKCPVSNTIPDFCGGSSYNYAPPNQGYAPPAGGYYPPPDTTTKGQSSYSIVYLWSYDHIPIPLR